MQDVLQMQCLRAGHGGMDWRRPEQSGSKRVLHSHTEQAPPAPVPALGGSSSERSRSTQGPRTDELCDEAERLVVPTSAGLAREHAQPLRSSPKELGVGSALAAFGDGQGSTVPGGGGGLRAAITGKRRDQRHVAAQRFAELCAPYATKSRRRRSSGSTPGAGVRTSHCCGTTWPSGPSASRTTRIHARSNDL